MFIILSILKRKFYVIFFVFCQLSKENLMSYFEYSICFKMKINSPTLSVLSALERKQAAFTAFRLYKTAAALVCCSPSGPIIRVHFEQCALLNMLSCQLWYQDTSGYFTRFVFASCCHLIRGWNIFFPQ